MIRLAVVLALVLCLAPPAQAAEKPTGPHILTISGDVLHPNRPAFNAFRDAFLKFHDKSFERAFAFDRAMLAALPQRKLRANSYNFPSQVTAEGPLLSDVLGQAGVREQAPITVTALDGYTVTLTAEDRAATTYILAITVDGQPLGLAGRGPTWLIEDTGGVIADEATEAKWVWSAFYMEVGDIE